VGFRLTGDFSGLQRKIDQLAKPEVALVKVAQAMSDEGLNLTNESFETETNPYGEPWDLLVLRSGKILQDKGGMAASWHRKSANKSGFRISNGKIYAIYHQTGTGIYGPSGQPIVPKNGKALAFGVRNAGKTKSGRVKTTTTKYVFRSVKGAPARKMVPDADKPLPLRWKQRLVRAGKAALKVHFGV
jgi:phage gpG-like protein